MELDRLVRRLIDFLTPTVSHLAKHGREGLRVDLHLDSQLLQATRHLWGLLEPVISSRHELRHSLDAFGAAPEDEECRRAVRSVVKDILSHDVPLAREMESFFRDVDRNRCPRTKELSLSVAGPPGPADKAFQRLEIVRLLRSGIDPNRIAAKFKVDLPEIFSTNYLYSTAGAEGAILTAGSAPTWVDQLDNKDPLLRRLEMVRLLRTGTPASAVARQFDALEDYVLLIGQRFAEHGLPGIITDEDKVRFGPLHDEIRICSYNLQGVRKDGPFRFRLMARELSGYRPDLIAFQEVVSGAGVEDTGGQMARWLSSMSGEHYRSDFTYCHQFMDKYPEGVAVCARVPMKVAASIDLTANLSKGLRPSMDRRAHVAEAIVSGKKVLLVSVHLDHVKAGDVRRAQAEKLLSELDRLTLNIAYHALVLAGDLNDVEDSPALMLLKDAGYRDSYRACHKKGGATFPVPNPHSRIDYILVKGPAEILSAEIILNNTDFSDHLGVIAVLK